MTIAVLASLALLVPANRGHQVRDTASCGRGAAGELTVNREPGRLEVEFGLQRSRTPGAAWRVVLVHESHVAWRGQVHADRREGGWWLRHAARDYPGADRVIVRALARDGTTCGATVTVAGQAGAAGALPRPSSPLRRHAEAPDEPVQVLSRRGQ
jgi:hypothetical protein